MKKLANFLRNFLLTEPWLCLVIVALSSMLMACFMFLVEPLMWTTVEYDRHAQIEREMGMLSSLTDDLVSMLVVPIVATLVMAILLAIIRYRPSGPVTIKFTRKFPWEIVECEK